MPTHPYLTQAKKYEKQMVAFLRDMIAIPSESGLYAIENKAHIHDIHPTILALLGRDHEALTFPHNGRDERLTITSGKVI